MIKGGVKHHWPRLIATLAAVSLAGIPTGAHGQTLSKDGIAKLPIAARDGSATADELQRYLTLMSGAEFARVGVSKDVPGIFLGIQGEFPKAPPVPGDKLGAEEFIIRSDGGSLYLVDALTHRVIRISVP